MDLNDSNAELVYMTTTEGSCTIKAGLIITCSDTNFKNDTAITPKSVHCTTVTQEERTSAMDTSTISTQPNITHAEMTTQPICKCQEAGSAASIGLGALMGLLVVLLALVTTGWIWTCWITKKRARITTNSRDIR